MLPQKFEANIIQNTKELSLSLFNQHHQTIFLYVLRNNATNYVNHNF